MHKTSYTTGLVSSSYTILNIKVLITIFFKKTYKSIVDSVKNRVKNYLSPSKILSLHKRTAKFF